MDVRTVIAAILIAVPAAAQDDPSSIFEDFSRSAREALEALGALTGAWAEGLSPILADPEAYDPPVTLPNGDIVIRRKPQAAPEAPPSEPAPSPGPGGDAVDL
jgi:hypothetical protein